MKGFMETSKQWFYPSGRQCLSVFAWMVLVNRLVNDNDYCRTQESHSLPEDRQTPTIDKELFWNKDD